MVISIAVSSQERFSFRQTPVRDDNATRPLQLSLLFSMLSTNRKNATRKLIGGFLLSLSVLTPAAYLVLVRPSDSPGGLHIGDQVPPLTIAPGMQVSGSDSLRGRKRVLFFLSGACPHCVRMAASIGELCSRFGSRLHMLCICLSDPTTSGVMLSMLDGRIPVVFPDPLQTRERFGVQMIPSVLLIDENDILRERESGERSLDYLSRRLRSFMEMNN